MRGTVVVTASAGTFPGLAEALRALPAAVEERPLMTFAPPLDWGPVDRAIEALEDLDGVAVTSPRAARAFAERLGPATGLPGVWAAGEGTAAALGRAPAGVRTPPVEAVGRLGAAGALVREMLAAGVRGPVLFPCGDIRRDELPARLRAEGIEVREVVCYRSVLAGESVARDAAERARVIVVASPSVADLLARACPEGVRPALLAVGPTTAAAARASGWPPAAVARRPSVDALVAGVRSLLATS
ncbi:MAG TPA: uroporphyrinogen-III synthase [Gemmatimonadales bacterium]|nr:uroporphyrinogen-III synthase [Gemmatimonadales bacterium]